MESVIPPEVLAHLRELSDASPLDGCFTTRNLAEQMDCGISKARRIIRGMVQDGKVRPKRVSVTQEEAWEMGMLGGSGVMCYEWLESQDAT